MISVLQVIDTLSPGGAERVLVELANLLDPRQFESMVCTTRAGGTLADALAPNVRYVPLVRSGRWDMRMVYAFGRMVRDRRIQVIHSHGRGSMRFVAFARCIGALNCWHVFHDHWGELEGEMSASLSLRLCARVGFDAYIGVDQRLCEWARRQLGLPEDRVFLVRNGVDLRRFDEDTPVDVRTEFGLPQEALVLVMLAHWRPQKDHPTLLRALAQSRHRERVRLLLVGRRPERFTEYVQACDALIQDLRLKENVVDVGVRHDIPALLAGCDIGVLSSRSESGPLALLEYLAAGLPYVVTATGEVSLAVQGTHTGRTVPVGDAAAFAAAVDGIADLPGAERIAMGKRGRELALREFDQRVTAARVGDIYHRLCPVAAHDEAPCLPEAMAKTTADH